MTVKEQHQRIIETHNLAPDANLADFVDNLVREVEYYKLRRSTDTCGTFDKIVTEHNLADNLILLAGRLRQDAKITAKLGKVAAQILTRRQNTLNRAEKFAPIILMRRSGATLQSIGEKFNLTGERVRQIVEQYSGLIPDTPAPPTTQADPVMDEYIRLSTEMMRLEEDYVNPPREKP